jgi:hypothetical protein
MSAATLANPRVRINTTTPDPSPASVAAPVADRVCVRLSVAGILDRPLPAWGYFDLVAGWVKRPLIPRAHDQLLRACPKFDARNITAWFDHRYRQWLQLTQLTEAALRILIDATDDEMLLNRAEFALDLLPPDAASHGHLAQQLPHMILQPWNVGHEPQAFEDGFVTRRYEPGASKRGHWLHHYCDRECRIDGTPLCVHLQSCVQGAVLMRCRGIHKPSDLLRFCRRDLVPYWQKWLRLYHRDLERLGRFDDNRWTGSSRQRPRIKHWGRLGAVNLDRRRGWVVYHIHSFSDDQPSTADPRSLQQFVNSYGKGPFLTRMPIAITYTLSMGMCEPDIGLLQPVLSTA